MNWILRFFRQPTVLETAARELGELERAVLEATGTREWAQHRVNFALQRIKYLKEFLTEEAP